MWMQGYGLPWQIETWACRHAVGAERDMARELAGTPVRLGRSRERWSDEKRCNHVMGPEDYSPDWRARNPGQLDRSRLRAWLVEIGLIERPRDDTDEIPF